MYEREKGPKLKSFDFGSFQEKCKCHHMKKFFFKWVLIYGHVKETSCCLFHVTFLGNHFWTCLYQSGILSESITSDRDVEVLSNGVGLVNVVSRTTASSQDLSSAEIREGCRRLVDKLQLLQVFIGLPVIPSELYHIARKP